MNTPKEKLKPYVSSTGTDFCDEINELRISEAALLNRETELIEALKGAREALEVAQKEDCECDCRYEPPSGQCIHCKADEALSRIEQVLGEKK